MTEEEKPPGQPAEQPTEELRAEQPAAEQPAAEQPAQPAPVPPRRNRVRGFVGHRATQIVAAGVLGLILGGGIVALAGDDDGPRKRWGGGPDRGHSKDFHRFDERGGPFDRFDR